MSLRPTCICHLVSTCLSPSSASCVQAVLLFPFVCNLSEFSMLIRLVFFSLGKCKFSVFHFLTSHGLMKTVHARTQFCQQTRPDHQHTYTRTRRKVGQTFADICCPCKLRGPRPGVLHPPLTPSAHKARRLATLHWALCHGFLLSRSSRGGLYDPLICRPFVSSAGSGPRVRSWLSTAKSVQSIKG